VKITTQRGVFLALLLVNIINSIISKGQEADRRCDKDRRKRIYTGLSWNNGRLKTHRLEKKG